VLDYDAFTDIEFNPEKSVSCQASSAALAVDLRRAEYDLARIAQPARFRSLFLGARRDPQSGQVSLF